MDRDSLDPKVCACCCSLAAEEAEEHARLDQTEMTLSLPRRLRDIRIASRSCVICAVFLEVLSFFGVPCDAYDRTEVTLLLPIGPGNIQIASRARGARSVAQLYSSAKLRSPWQRVLPLPDVCTHQLSPQGRGFITTCLQTCLQSHPVCRAVTTWNHKVPQRLLYVGRSGDEDVLRLVDTAGTSPGAYTALSYSWGGAVTTKTTRANMAEMKQHIRLADLQDTLVDAVVLTRALGVDYLWVDSLCIVQDSIEDWERESAKMASVYANALITIASVSSTSAAVPFLRQENSVEATKHQGIRPHGADGAGARPHQGSAHWAIRYPLALANQPRRARSEGAVGAARVDATGAGTVLAAADALGDRDAMGLQASRDVRVLVDAEPPPAVWPHPAGAARRRRRDVFLLAQARRKLQQQGPVAERRQAAGHFGHRRGRAAKDAVPLRGRPVGGQHRPGPAVAQDGRLGDGGGPPRPARAVLFVGVGRRRGRLLLLPQRPAAVPQVDGCAVSREPAESARAAGQGRGWQTDVARTGDCKPHHALLRGRVGGH